MMDDYLFHYGVKGMKWGVRKTPERSSVVRTKKVPMGKIGKVRIKKKIRSLNPFNLLKRNKEANNYVKVRTKRPSKQKKKKEKDIYKIPIGKLSDSQLDQRLQRRDKEKRLQTLESSMSTAKKGKSIIGELLTNSLKSSAQQVLTQQITKRVNAKLDQSLGDPSRNKVDDLFKAASAREKNAQAATIELQNRQRQQQMDYEEELRKNAYKRAKHARRT